MTDCKIFEVRDAGTLMPVLAIRPGGENEATSKLWARAGYGANRDRQERYVILLDLNGDRAEHDPYAWTGNRTMFVAHHYLRDQVHDGNWQALPNGMTIDCEWLLGERHELKEPYAGGAQMLINEAAHETRERCSHEVVRWGIWVGS